MEFATNGNGNGLNDLYILTDNAQQKRFILNECNYLGIPAKIERSTVEGQSWHGKHFINLAFGESHRERFEDIPQNLDRKWEVYQLRFKGRRTGAIGSMYDCIEYVEAPNAGYAMRWIYRTHEHIAQLQIEKG